MFFLLVLRILHSRCIPKPKARAQQALVFTKLCLYILFSFFSGNYGRCLLNKPQTNALDWFKSASQYPGQHFDENRLPQHQQFYESLAVLNKKILLPEIVQLFSILIIKLLMHVCNRQCEFVFGNGSKICSYMVNMFPIFMSHLSDCCKQPLKAHLPPPSPVEIPLPTQLTTHCFIENENNHSMIAVTLGDYIAPNFTA